jgi:nucleotide-binding universal stress UspA family protein
MHRIVVGVDGSEESKAALRWALDEGRLRSAGVRAIYAWAFPHMDSWTTGYVATTQPNIDAVQHDAEEFLDSLIAEAKTEGVDVGRAAVEGSATQVLVEAAAEADLLVVGSRGHGGFAGLLLGSVSQQCAQHAPCPVVIVRGKAK